MRIGHIHDIRRWRGGGHQFNTKDYQSRMYSDRDCPYPVNLTVNCTNSQDRDGCNRPEPGILNNLVEHNFMPEPMAVPLDLRQFGRATGLLKIEVNDPLHPVPDGPGKEEEIFYHLVEKMEQNEPCAGEPEDVFRSTMFVNTAPALDDCHTISSHHTKSTFPPVQLAALNAPGSSLAFAVSQNQEHEKNLHSNENKLGSKEPSQTFWQICPTEHRRIHVEKKQLRCDKWHRTFSQRKKMIQHKHSHAGEKPYGCNWCDKTFRRRESRFLHKCVHTDERRFLCHRCGETFTLYCSLVRHQRIHGERVFLFKCDHCNGTFKRRLQLKRHRITCGINNLEHKTKLSIKFDEMFSSNTNHMKHVRKDNRKTDAVERPIKCDKCTKMFTNNTQLFRHQRVHTKVTPFKCNFCQKSFKDSDSLTQHRLTHIGERVFCCEFCEKTFPEKKGLFVHKRTCRRNKAPPRFVCDHCGQVFVQASSFKAHKRCHTGEKPFKCMQCKRSFAAKRYLADHTRLIHSGEKRCMCDVCGKVFAKRDNLIQHKNIHTGEKPYKCDLCDSSWAARSNLSKHKMKIHSTKPMKPKRKPYKCDQCDKAFDSTRNLVSHQRIHTGERPFRCDMCEKSFPHKSTLASHMLRIHIKEKPFACDQCDKKYAYEKDLKKHKILHTGYRFKCDLCVKEFTTSAGLWRHRQLHSGLKSHPCNVCGKAFTRKAGLLEHQRLHEGKRPFGCDLCGKTFTQAGGLRQHKRTHSTRKT